MKHIAIFASGNGSNAQSIAEYFAQNSEISVATIIYNRKEAFVAQRARNLGIEARYFPKKDFETPQVLEYLKSLQVDYIILAGFLLLVPGNLLEAYSNKIINIHPSLLPKHGGKGMYGLKVHEEVIKSHDTHSGITIHRVNEKYDEGEILFQAQCPVLPADTPEELALRVHQLEYAHFPQVIEQTILQDSKQ